MTSITTDLDKLNVTKSNKLIQIKLMESKTMLSVKDQKIILSVVSQINPDDEDFKDYKLSINDISKITGMKKQNIHTGINEACTRLMTSPITIKEPSNPKGFLIVNWFSHAEYLPDDGNINFSISPRIKPYLLQLKGQFTSYRLNQIMSLQSSYSIRIYELLRQFLPMNYKNKNIAFREITIEDLRGYMGVEDGKYPRFADLKNKIIVRCQKELLKETDLCFDFEPIRRGRRMHAIKFTIKYNPKFNAQAEKQEQQPMAMGIKTLNEGIAAMIKMNIPDITETELITIANLYDESVIRESILDLVNEVMSGHNIETTHKKYFYGVLKNKGREYNQIHQTTLQKLTDRDWDDGPRIEI
jgi:plasmid replication initiation protein